MATKTKTESRPVIKLTPAVRFREFPFGTPSDPSMRDYTQSEPWAERDNLLAYLRSGHILAVTMGARLTDCINPAKQVSVAIDGVQVGGTTPMTDGHWFWYSGLIYFVERYNLLPPKPFIEYARGRNWKVDPEFAQDRDYDYSYHE